MSTSNRSKQVKVVFAGQLRWDATSWHKIEPPARLVRPSSGTPMCAGSVKAARQEVAKHELPQGGLEKVLTNLPFASEYVFFFLVVLQGIYHFFFFGGVVGFKGNLITTGHFLLLGT